MVEESIGERECKKFVEGLNKLTLYKTFSKEVQFKKYLHDAGTRFRSGTHGLNEELGKHRGKKEGVLCGDECESVCHVLWAYSSIRAAEFVEIVFHILKL